MLSGFINCPGEQGVRGYRDNGNFDDETPVYEDMVNTQRSSEKQEIKI